MANLGLDWSGTKARSLQAEQLREQVARSKLVKICVGKHERLFYVHEAPLRLFKSPFFNDCLIHDEFPGFEEVDIKIPLRDPQACRLFKNSMLRYTSVEDQWKATKSRQLTTVVEAWDMADKWGLEEIANDYVDGFRAFVRPKYMLVSMCLLLRDYGPRNGLFY